MTKLMTLDLTTRKGFGALPLGLLSRLTSNKGEGMMTMAEMEVNLPHLVIGGSETIATTLSGTIIYLRQNAAVLKKIDRGGADRCAP